MWLLLRADEELLSSSMLEEELDVTLEDDELDDDELLESLSSAVLLRFSLRCFLSLTLSRLGRNFSLYSSR